MKLLIHTPSHYEINISMLKPLCCFSSQVYNSHLLLKFVGKGLVKNSPAHHSSTFLTHFSNLKY